MCGIAGFHIKPAAKGRIQAGLLMDWLLKGIENRGREATGFISVGFDNQITVDKAPVAAMDFIQTRKAIKSAPQTVLGHTRLATQGHPNFAENNHPVQYGTVFVTHNGWIINDDSLLKDAGLERTAEVDTIAIPAMIWNYNENGFEVDGVQYALEQLEGAMAIAAVDVTDPGKLLLARGNSSPLVSIENKDIIIWGSTVQAIQQAWGKVFGTPPKATRFRVWKEGEFALIKDGEFVHTGEFKTAYAARYNWGYHNWDDSEDEPWWTKQYTDANTQTTSKGTWINMPDGSRTYIDTSESDPVVELSGEAVELVGEAVSPRPSASDIDICRSMSGWAKIDAEAHEDAIWGLANALKLPMTTAAWIYHYADEQVLDANPSVKRAKEYMIDRYPALYDDSLSYLLEKMGDKDDTPPVQQVEVEPFTYGVEPAEALSLVQQNGTICIRCDEDTEDVLDFYCSNCITQMSRDAEATA